MKGLASVLVLLLCASGKVEGNPKRDKLYADLFAKYNPDVIPLFMARTPLEVKYGISLQQILAVDIHGSRFVSNLWFNYGWKDSRLTWNESDYGGVKSIRVREDAIWMPDIQLYNSLATTRVFSNRIVVSSDGTCSYVPPAEVVSSCAYDLTWFPFDTQHCILKFGSWTYDGSKVNLTSMNDKVDTSTYMPHGAWDLLNASAKRHEVHYECCPERYIDITFTFEIRRRGAKYIWESVVPAVVVAFLVPVLFLLPPNNAAKCALGGGLLVSLMLMISMINGILPEDIVKRPMLGVYYDMTLILVAIALALSAAISGMAFKSGGNTPPPGLLKTILLDGLGRVLCVSYDRKYGTPAGNDLESDGNSPDSQSSAVTSAAYEWRLIATVLDRLFLIIFLFIVFVASIAILPK